MKAKLAHGTELEFITKDELREVLQEVASGWARPPQRARPVAAIGLNASGNSTAANGDLAGTEAAVVVNVFQIPVGYSFRLHRATFEPDGSTFGSPFTNAAGFLNIMRGGLLQDGISFGSPGLPLVWSAGTADAIDYTNGESVGILVSGGPASKSLAVRLQGTLEPIVRQ